MNQTLTPAEKATLTGITLEVSALSNNRKHLTEVLAHKRGLVNDPETSDDERAHYERSLATTEAAIVDTEARLADWTDLGERLAKFFGQDR